MNVFVTGGTGYLGRPLLIELLARGHRPRALVRPQSVHKLPPGIDPVVGDALDHRSFASAMAPGETLVQLVGVPNPRPSKARQFRDIDLVSAGESLAAARRAGARHLVYVSVAQPAPVMRAYLAVRAEVEAMIRESGLPATILRPWYVLGPGHRWPYLLVPLYWIGERIAATREGARRLGLVTLREMTAALVRAVEEPADGLRILAVPEIRAAASKPPSDRHAFLNA